MGHKKNRLKTKSIVTYPEKYITLHILSGDLLSLNENVIFWKKWQISKPKIVDWYLDFS